MPGGPEAWGLIAGALVVGAALGEPVAVLPGRAGVMLPAGVAVPAGVTLPAGVAPAGKGLEAAGAPPDEPGSRPWFRCDPRPVPRPPRAMDVGRPDPRDALTGLFSYYFKSCLPPAWQSLSPSAETLGYLIPAALGVCFLLLAVAPLASMPHVNVAGTRRVPSAKGGGNSGRHTACACYLTRRQRLGSLPACGSLSRSAVLARMPLRLLVLFSNGVTQAAQNIYPKSVLKLSLLAAMVLPMGMRLGQLAVSPWLGRIADRWGNKRLMLASLPLVASDHCSSVSPSRGSPGGSSALGWSGSPTPGSTSASRT